MRRAAVIAVVLALAGCSGGDGGGTTAASPPGLPSFDRATATIQTAGGPVKLDVEIAETEAQRDFGLMGRRSLPDDAGMAFLFAGDTDARFWMKDTLIPLSVAFADADGRILKIVDMEPCKAEPCPLYGAGAPYRTALETNEGALARLGVKAGDTLTIDR